MAYHLRFYTPLEEVSTEQWEGEEVDVARKGSLLLDTANQCCECPATCSTSPAHEPRPSTSKENHAVHPRSAPMCGAGGQLERAVVSLSVSDVVMHCVAQPSANAANALTRHTVLRYVPPRPMYPCRHMSSIHATACANDCGDRRPCLIVPCQEEASPSSLRPMSIEGELGSSSLHSVFIGLTCLLSVLEGLSRHQPEVCVSALQSLRHLLEGMAHGTLRAEPYPLVRAIFDLLRTLRTTSACPNVRRLATECLLALAIAHGLPELLVATVETFVCDGTAEAEGGPGVGKVAMPRNYAAYTAAELQGARHDWLRSPVTDNHALASIPIHNTDGTVVADIGEVSCAACIASDGAYIYVLTRTALIKLGSGCMETIHAHVYAYNTGISSAPGTWMGVCEKSLYLRREQSTRLWVLATDTLCEIGEVLLPTASSGHLCTDGRSFSLATLVGQRVSWRALDENFAVVEGGVDSPTTPSADLSTNVFVSHGSVPVVAHLDTLMCHTSLDLQVGRDLAFLLTTAGDVYYQGKGSVVGLADSPDVWAPLSIVGRVSSMKVALDSNNAAFLTPEGHLWLANGMPSINAFTPNRVGPHHPEASAQRIVRVAATSHPRRRVIDYAVNAACLVYVSEQGRVFMLGRHAMHTEATSGQVLGLDHVHMARVAVGKTHAVGVTRHGYLYSWGLNNMYQCGRDDADPAPAAVTSPRRDTSDTTLRLCAPGSHMWVSDVATVCTACRQCTAHGRGCTADAQPSCVGESGCLRCGVCRQCGESKTANTDDGSTTTAASDRSGRRMVLSPARVHLPGESRASLVVCGNYHTIVLGTDGHVFTFGSNCHGQLGVGDIRRRVAANRVDLPDGDVVSEIVAGANHSCLLTLEGRLLTFGADKMKQLGRTYGDGVRQCAHSSLSPMETMGGEDSRRARHVVCGVDYTLVRCTQHVILATQFEGATITGSHELMMIFPKESNEYIVVKLGEGASCAVNVHGVPGGVMHTSCSWHMDTAHDVLWVYDAENEAVTAYSPQLTTGDKPKATTFLRAHEFLLPHSPRDEEGTVSTDQLALSTMATLYSTTISVLHSTNKRLESLEEVEGEEYRVMERFGSQGGGWGYSPHSVEAIQFSVSMPVKVSTPFMLIPRQLHGVGLFGGRGEYVARVRLLQSTGSAEIVLSETDDAVFECPAKDKAHVLLPAPVPLQVHQWYTLHARVYGPCSDCGAMGQTVVLGADGLTVTFRNSALSNNGTDVGAGQIAQLLYSHDVEMEAMDNYRKSTSVTPRPLSLLTITPPTLQSVLRLLAHVVNAAFAFDATPSSEQSTDSESTSQRAYDCELNVVMGVMLLRLLGEYLGLLYPCVPSRTDIEPVDFICHVSEWSTLLARVCSRGQSLQRSSPVFILLEEAVRSAVHVAHVLSPCTAVAQHRLTALMGGRTRDDWALVVMLQSLCRDRRPLRTLLAEGQGALVGGHPQLASHMLRHVHARTAAPLEFAALLRFVVELCFAPATPDEAGIARSHLRDAGSQLLARIAEELAANGAQGEAPILQSKTRFARSSSSANWETGTSSTDAIAFTVETASITLHAVGVFIGTAAEYEQALDVLVHETGDTWHVLEKCSGTVHMPAVQSERTALVRLPKPVKLHAGTRYAIRVTLSGRSKTWSGESGESSIPLLGGGQLVFDSCPSLSVNGTTVNRGQIPFFRYSHHSLGSDKSCTPEEASKHFLALLRSLCLKLLDCLTVGCVPCNQWLFASIFGWTGVFLETNAARALDVISTIDELLPVVAAANGQRSATGSTPDAANAIVSTHVDSPHPYPLGTVLAESVTFDGCTDYVSIDFDKQCRSASEGHVLSIYVQSSDTQYVLVGRYSMENWPTNLLLVPGHAVWFVFETEAGEVERSVEPSDEAMFGYSCVVHSHRASTAEPLLQLEQELSWLCASACRHLLRSLGTVDISEKVVGRHGALLRRGLHLGHMPTIGEAIARVLPAKATYPQLRFLTELCACSPHTTAGRLARWLSSHRPFVDVHQCELALVDVEEDVLVGRSTRVSLHLKDQFARIARSQQPMSIAVSVRQGGDSAPSTTTTHRLPSLALLQRVTYQPTLMNKARYVCMTMMPAYSGFCLDELRMAYFRDTVMCENLTMRQRADGSYVGRWIGRVPGAYRVECRLDGVQLPQSIQLDVLQSQTLPHAEEVSTRRPLASHAKTAVVRDCVTVGVRLRASASLLGHVLAVLPKGASITYVEEVVNTDGTWLRVADDVVGQYCPPPTGSSQCLPTAWVLQYHGHSKRAIMHVHETSVSPPLHLAEYLDASHSIVVASDDVYSLAPTITRVPVRQRPSLDAHVIGWVGAEQTLSTDGWMHNSGGVWLRSKSGYCLARSIGGEVFLVRKTPNVEVDERGRPLASVAPSPRPGHASVMAMSPSTADALRASFAAFLWHEMLVQDATACAAYLKYHPELHPIASPPTPHRRRPPSDSTNTSTSSNCGTPTALQPLIKIWRDVETAVMAVVDASHGLAHTPGGTGIRGGVASIRGGGGDELCELCEMLCASPITRHLRQAHGGCGEQANGYGYNARGRYSGGWSGVCGEGDGEWYLLCRPCRLHHLQQPAVHHKWVDTHSEHSSQTAIKRNALFLLELNCRADVPVGEPPSGSEWTVNMFPSLDTPPLVRSLHSTPHTVARKADQSTSTARVDAAPHVSDPGPGLALRGGRSLRQVEEGEPPGTRSMQAPGLVSSPSRTLSALMQYEHGVARRPAVAFCLGHHQLDVTRQAMQTAIHRATLLSHVFKVFNWMLRLVSAESSVIDVLWQYLACMAQYAHQSHVLAHPWRLCVLGGPLCKEMIGQFHGLLQTISVILRSASVSGHLQRLCYRAWTFQLTVHEQDLLMLTCDILSTVAGTLAADTHSLTTVEAEGVGTVDVVTMRDVAGNVVLAASSRANMTGALTDGTLDTFWESGEADKARPRHITLQWAADLHATLLCVYISNARDTEHRTQHVLVTHRQRRLGEHILGAEFCGWLKYRLPSHVDRLNIELRGSEASCRVRGIQLLASGGTQHAHHLRPSASIQLAFNAVQTDAFALFQSIAGQVFNEHFADSSGAIRHQVLDMLFSSRQLHPLQTYVCQQIVAAVEKEVETLRQRVARRNYTYVCGLLVMLTKVGQSPSGREVFARRSRLLASITLLVQFSPSLVQCQALDALEKVVTLFEPRLCEAHICIEHLLVVLARQASMLMRQRLRHGNRQSTMSMGSAVGGEGGSEETTHLVRHLLETISDGRLGGDRWRRALHQHLAAHIRRLADIANRCHTIEECAADPAFWLVLAALSVVDSASSITSTSEWQTHTRSGRPSTLCDNHDDGRTLATLSCAPCDMALCRECYTGMSLHSNLACAVLHLARRNRSHAVEVLEEVMGGVPEMDVHEGCARLRLPTLLLLFDGATLNGMCEVGDPPHTDMWQMTSANPRDMLASMGSSSMGTAVCRFCERDGADRLTRVCEAEECRRAGKLACTKTLAGCGHECQGVVNEHHCLPCLRCPPTTDSGLRQDGDDLCVICFTDRLGARPCVQLPDCGHVFHYACVRQALERRWGGPRITFTFSKCPICQTDMRHALLDDLLRGVRELQADIRTKAQLRLEYDGLARATAVTSPSSAFHDDPLAYALDKYVYVQCAQCERAYFGGEVQCQQALATSEYNPAELVCGGCSNTAGGHVCPRHGTEFLEYKCRFCCSVAIFFCFGTSHFCNGCHEDFHRLMALPKSRLPHCPAGPRGVQLEGDKCPLDIKPHPNTGDEAALGCAICRNLQTF